MRRNLLTCLAVLAIAAPAAAQQPERETPPPPGPLRPFTVPVIRETRLPNGLRIVVAERRSLPIVHARVIVNAGAVHEPVFPGLEEAVHLHPEDTGRHAHRRQLGHAGGWRQQGEDRSQLPHSKPHSSSP